MQFVLRFSVVHSSIANNFNPFLFAFVNDSFPLKFTNGHKRRVAPTTQSAALFLFLSCFSLYLPSHLCSFSVILAWNMISRNVENDNHRARRNNSTRSLERLWEKEQRHTVTLRSRLLIFILRRVSALRDSSSNRNPCAQYFAFLRIPSVLGGWASIGRARLQCSRYRVGARWLPIQFAPSERKRVGKSIHRACSDCPRCS